jgi:hypothetical protein
MNAMKIHKLTLMAGLAGWMTATAHAQFPAQGLAVLRAGDNGTSAASSLAGAHQAPTFVDAYSAVTPIVISSTNTGTNGPLFSVAIPTNDPGAMWFNGHAGTEGYLALSEDLSSLTFSGYGGDILAQSGTPSQLNINRGICVIAASGASSIAYEGSDWYGLGAGTQTNPRGVVSDDGVDNFWGSGSLDGTEWFNPTASDPPVTVQNLNSSRQVKIINGVFYTSLQEGDGGGQYPQGIYNLQTFGGGFPVTLPIGDSFFLNLVVPASAQYPNVEGFDMNPQRNIAYTADNTYGIQKYIEVNGNWSLACNFALTNNTSTGAPIYPGSYTGCFGLAVDWSGANPVVFATTTEGRGGYANSNRLVRLDDNFNFTDGQVHDVSADVVTLATGWSGNIAFRGLAWTPNLSPAITSNPANQSVVAGTPASFTVTATAVYANTYQWLVNGAQDASQTTATYTVSSPTLGQSGNTYQVIVSNTYGAVTSTVAALTVTASAVAPSLVSPVPPLQVTNAIFDTVTLPLTASGTTPLSYSWYQSASPGSTSQLNDTGDFSGTATGTLTIKASSTADSGSYYAVINNGVGSPASNLVAAVSIINPLPIIYSEPINAVAASNGVAVFSVLAYPLSATFQWYQGSTPLNDGGRWSGSQTDTLEDSNVQESDATNYYVVVTSIGGSVTSSIAALTVAPAAPYSALPYTSVGSVYTQNFDTLPDPGTVSVNHSTVTFPTETTATIGGTNYNVLNPFDFAAPLVTLVVSSNAEFGGLNLPGMVGWFSSDLGNEQIQATSGDNTTGLIVSFGCTNATAVNPLYPTNNRALGIISSPATSPSGNAGDTSDGLFALRIRNLSGQTLSNFSLSYVSELWRNTFATNMVTNWFYVDTLGTNSTPTNNWTGGLTNLQFATNLGVPLHASTKIWGTNAPIATTNMAFVNVPLATPWPEGGILWIVWEEVTAVSGGQGIGIDNLVFTAGPGVQLGITPTNISGTNALALSWPAMLTSYSLQYNSAPKTTGWQNVTISPPVTETNWQGMNIVTLPVSGSEQFFRLMAP